VTALDLPSDLLDPGFLAWLAEHATDEERAVRPQLRELVEAQRYNWRSVARPEQLAPEGEWLIWLIHAGRGWGKTKTGAERVREKAEENPGCRIALVGASLDDVRDTMVDLVDPGGPVAGVDLVLAHPVAQARLADPEALSDLAHRALTEAGELDCALPELRRMRSRHNDILPSRLPPTQGRNPPNRGKVRTVLVNPLQ
jgi:hypothetical protein